MDTYYLVKGDTGATLKVQLIANDTGELLDLESKTVNLYFRKKGTTKLLSTIPGDVILETSTVLFSFDGLLQTIEPGYYQGEIEVTNQGLSSQTVYETLRFKVRDEIG